MITIGDRTLAWHVGMTLAEVARELDLPESYAYASLAGKIIWKKDWATTVVPDGAHIRFRGIVAGG
jgi:sulfur carrier protein ThiS